MYVPRCWEAGADEQGVCAQYTAVPQAVGAPLRTVTVRDAIGDLPPITNGACQVELPYSGAPFFEYATLLLHRPEGQRPGRTLLCRVSLLRCWQVHLYHLA